MADLDFARAYATLEAFVTTLSTWYVRLAKPTLWRDGLDDEKRATYEALFGALDQLALVAAPFLPFLADAMYAELGHERSVHLEDWPPPHDVDVAAVADMRRLRDVVRLARSVRENANVKHRQPLRLARVAGLPDAMLAEHRALLETELNVKRVERFTATAQRALLLDFAKLGRRLRSRLATVKAVVDAGDYRENSDGSVEVRGVTLAADEVSWRTLSASERGTASRDGLVVSLDLSLDEALVREASARELVRAVQDLRKQARLRYGEPVTLSVVGDSAELAAMLEVHAPWVADQCSASHVARVPLAAPLRVTTTEVCGASVTLALGAR